MMSKFSKLINFILKGDFIKAVSFRIRHRYWPHFDIPRTFNEKIQYRKKHWDNKNFVLCADKVEAKKYVSDLVGDKYIIETYFSDVNVSASTVKAIIEEKDSIVLKVNNGSGDIKFLDKSSSETCINDACSVLNELVLKDFGNIYGEGWYSDIKPQILIEKKLEGLDLPDYKFHVFNNPAGKSRTILQMDYDRFTNHNRSFFDEELNYIPFSLNYPSIKPNFDVPANYNLMLEIVHKISKNFSYVRVDLYNVNGDIYFGELTFSHGTGNEVFSFPAYDYWLGNLWLGNPAK